MDPTVQAELGLSADVVNSLIGKLADSIIHIFQWSVLLPIAALVFAILMGSARLVIAKPSTGASGQQETIVRKAIRRSARSHP